jgi:hypothetical protein
MTNSVDIGFDGGGNDLPDCNRAFRADFAASLRASCARRSARAS